MLSPVSRQAVMMARVIAIGPGGRVQAPVRDDRFRPVIELVLASGLLGRPLLSPVCKTMDAADDVRRGLYRSARYYCSCGEPYCTRKHDNISGCPAGGQRVSCQAKIIREPGGKLRVQFTLFDKSKAIRAHIERYGSDPNAWPYFARRKQLRSGRT
jgi:hypothetical protein